MKTRGLGFFGFVLVAMLGYQAGYAGNTAPLCPAYGRDLAINNSQVLHWERTTANQFRERAHVQGSVIQVYPDRNGHEHFEIQIGNNKGDAIEVIYNQDFGAVPNVRIGQSVEACGDYITSTAQAGPYPPSPAGAIIHWVHMNPKGRGHEPGFLMIDGTVYGQDTEHAGPGHHGGQQAQGQGNNL